VNINMKELLKLAHSFPKVGKKTIDWKKSTIFKFFCGFFCGNI
jgi:hypothetical protein